MLAVVFLCICVAALFVGEFVSLITKARVPSVFITSLIFLIGYWTVFPKDIIAQASVTPALASIAIALCLVNLGSTFSIKDMMDQWKSVLITLLAMAGASIFILFVGALFMSRDLLMVGTPPFLGGVVAALIMKGAAEAKGLVDLGVFAVIVFVLQGFIGYPFLSYMVRRESKRLMAHPAELYDKRDTDKIRGGRGNEGDLSRNTSLDLKGTKKSFFAQITTTTYARILKLCILGSLAYFTSKAFAYIGLDVNAFVLCLIFGVLGRSIGFLENNELELAGGQGLALTFLMIYIFDALSKSTPQMVVHQIVPFITLAFFGLIGMAFTVFILARILNMSTNLAFACAINCLIGYPINYTIVKEVTGMVAKDESEQAALEHRLMPPVLVAGFVSVSITSVIVAGVFAAHL